MPSKQDAQGDNIVTYEIGEGRPSWLPESVISYRVFWSFDVEGKELSGVCVEFEVKSRIGRYESSVSVNNDVLKAMPWKQRYGSGNVAEWVMRMVCPELFDQHTLTAEGYQKMMTGTWPAE